MRVVVTYDRLTWKAAKSVPCTICGKRVRRQKTFGQTQNPFNTNPDGTVKTRVEIYASLKEQAQAWMDLPETHPGCSDADRQQG